MIGSVSALRTTDPAAASRHYRKSPCPSTSIAFDESRNADAGAGSLTVAGCERTVKRLLKEVGWSKVRQGSCAGHEIWASPNGTGKKVPVPAKMESRHTANAILKDTGLGKAVQPPLAGLAYCSPLIGSLIGSLQQCCESFAARLSLSYFRPRLQVSRRTVAQMARPCPCRKISGVMLVAVSLSASGPPGTIAIAAKPTTNIAMTTVFEAFFLVVW